MCPGGVAYPTSGVCPVSNARCLPVAARTRPNVILLISDDQGDGHHTQRGTAPTRQRYLLTRPGSVGRCVDVTLTACASAADCKTGEICLGGHCEAVSPTGCNSSAQCAQGSICLGGKCRV